MTSATLFRGLLVGTLLALGGCNSPRHEKEVPKGPAARNVAPAEELDPAQVTAFISLEQKAEAALTSGNLVQSKQLIQKGLHQTQQAGRQYDLHEARFSLLQGQFELIEGNTTNARRFFGDAMAVFRIRKNEEGTFEVHLAQSRLEGTTGDYPAAQRELDEAQKLLPSVKNPVLKGEFTFQQAELFASQTKHTDAARLFLEAAEQFHATQTVTREADSYVRLASCEESLEKPREAISSLEKAYKMYTANNDLEGAVKALHRLAQFSIQEERYKTATEQLKKVEALYLQLGRQSDAAKVSQRLSALSE